MGTITGTIGNDELNGTGEADVIEGLAGSDTLRGGLGNDTIRGGADSDRVYGDAGDDLVEGGDGSDYIAGGAGDDVIRGGGDDDFIDSQSDSGSDQIYGEDGNDGLYVTRSESAIPDTIVVDGGAGDDTIGVQLRGANAAIVDAGAGADRIRLSADSRTLLTLGSGSDVLLIYGNHSPGAEIAITDFEVGPAGDRLELDEFLNYRLIGWDKASNPFATGHFKLVQSGADALLQVDVDAAGEVHGATTLVRFQNLDAASLKPENFDGYPSDGSTPPDSSIFGTTGNDVLTGTGGADVIEGLGGNDFLTGAAGDDTIRGGDGADNLVGEAGDDRLEGGAGRDSLAGGSGDDRVFGGDDGDYINDRDGGSDELFGEGGNDSIDVTRFGNEPASDLIRANGGDGDDRISVQLYGLQTVLIDAGVGDDRVRIDSRTQTIVALGAGRDVLELDGYSNAQMSVVLTDFEAGAGGDRLDFDAYLGARLRNWDSNGNPFADGHLKLVQSGSETLLLFDPDGSGGASAAATLVTFRNLDATGLTSDNLDGFRPDGSIPAGLTLRGTTGHDNIEGGGGADLIEGLGGSDFLYGGAAGDTLRGGDDGDQLYGELGDDILEGGDGNDYLYGGFGNDRLYGGAGNDSFDDFRTGGSDLYFGEAGDDAFYISRFSPDAGASHSTISGGTGNDRVHVSLGGEHTLAVDLGDGDDYVTLSTSKPTIVTLGAGRDVYEFGPYYYQNALTTITDFEAGDRLELDRLLQFSLQNWDGRTNPFVSGHLRLNQSGADVVLEIDPDGPAGWVPLRSLITFRNMSADTLTADNFDSYDPFTARGTAGADTLTGGAGRDMVLGGGGSDLFLLGQGGDDAAFGGSGNDGFYLGAALTAGDQIDGGEGTLDQLALQGNYAGLTLGAHNLVGVEQLVLLPGSDARFGNTSGALYSYDLTAVDANVAAGQRFVVTGNTLRAGENITFNGSAETDGFFLFYGGNGTDILTGGQKDDGFFFGTDGRFGLSDRVDGRGGSADQLGLQGDYAGANKVVFGADQVKGIEFIVALSGVDARFGGSGAGYSYDLTVNNGNIAAGATMVISANALRSGETFTFNGSAETDGHFRIFSGAGADLLIGGSGNDEISASGGNDRIAGGLGADRLTGGEGADTFAYGSAAESTGLGFDTLIGLDVLADRIDLPGLVVDVSGSVDGGTLRRNSFDGDLAAAVDLGLQPGSALIFRPTAGDLSGREFLVVDGNGDGVYRVGDDYVFEIAQPVGPLVPGADFFI